MQAKVGWWLVLILMGEIGHRSNFTSTRIVRHHQLLSCELVIDDNVLNVLTAEPFVVSGQQHKNKRSKRKSEV
jgi:hypothetical protein